MATYNRINQEDKVISTDKVTINTWSNNTNILTTNFSSSTNSVYTNSTSQGNFFLESYKTDPSIDSTAEVQFTCGYGHKEGSGSKDFTNIQGAYGYSAAKCIYNQYRQLVFGDETSNFTFNGFTSNDIHVINVARGRYKHNLKPGSLNLKLDDGTNKFHLTDDSVTTSGSATVTNAGRQFNIVSGSNGIMSGSNLTQTSHAGTTMSGSYGFFYPDTGIIILNGEALRNDNVSYWGEGSANSTSQINKDALFASIKTGASFELDSEEKISSQYMFVRVKNSEFNYTTNPSYIDNNGDLNITSFADSPITYITTVGLYNDENNLVAVAKLSQPLKKDFTTETLIRVKLDY
tara:strand:+ start:5929 stop:6972 length:1044 start_codon:yes stop_codon:yes gene_type:complete